MSNLVEKVARVPQGFPTVCQPGAYNNYCGRKIHQYFLI